MLFFPDCSTASQATPGLVAGMPRCSKACHRCSLSCRRCSVVLKDALKVFSSTLLCSKTVHNYWHGMPVELIRDSGFPMAVQYAPMVWYTFYIDGSKCAHKVLSVIAGGWQWVKCIKLMFSNPIRAIASRASDKIMYTSYIAFLIAFDTTRVVMIKSIVQILVPIYCHYKCWW